MRKKFSWKIVKKLDATALKIGFQLTTNNFLFVDYTFFILQTARFKFFLFILKFDSDV